jgi:primosomal protein N' (replication factor Y)
MADEPRIFREEDPFLKRFADVAVPVPLRQTFTYRIPTELQTEIRRGSQVDVPFGRRRQPGFVVGLLDRSNVPDDKLKSIETVTYPDPVFDESLLRLARWVADYYVASLGEVLLTALPGGPRVEAKRKAPRRDTSSLGLAQAPTSLTEPQVQIMSTLTAALDEGSYSTTLLYGVTGSGKTEIYVQLARAAVERGKRALILVPEIALSFQVVERFRLAFGDRVGVFNSRLTRRARQDVWRAARAGELDVVVGPRSAVFTPLPNLGAVVVDEEHDHAYKQSDSPRYHAREVAIVRARDANAVVVLGSATPSLESYANVKKGKYRLLTLPERIDARPRPTVQIADLRAEDGGDGPVIFGRQLSLEMGAALERNEQVILFLNRRGYSPFVQCRECGDVASCESCDVSLTFHRKQNALVCHYCGARQPAAGSCASCGSLRLFFGGVGTQKVEDEVAAIFPDARLLRLDFDTTRAQGSYQEILRAFAAGEADVLLGTQMVAKGLDFPRVTLVGVVYADAGLNLPDFRSSERTFQILTQVAGRSGRGDLPGKVVLQTLYPDHYALVHAAAQDFDTFYEAEMATREELAYPPFSRISNLLFDGPREDRVMDSAGWVGDYLRDHASFGSIRFLGPAPQPLSRLKGKYRWHLALRHGQHAQLRGACEAALDAWGTRDRRFAGVRLSIDVDPVDLL